MTPCEHLRKIGDNYGLSCVDCGEKLSGFGYGGWFGNRIASGETCVHFFVPMGDEDTKIEVCLYCEMPKELITN